MPTELFLTMTPFGQKVFPLIREYRGERLTASSASRPQVMKTTERNRKVVLGLLA